MREEKCSSQLPMQNNDEGGMMHSGLVTILVFGLTIGLFEPINDSIIGGSYETH